MAVFENIPYTNFHDLNLDWIISVVKDFHQKYNHIQELIDAGIENIDNETRESLQALADQLAQDIASFEAQAQAYGQQVIESIPQDYTELNNSVIKMGRLINSAETFVAPYDDLNALPIGEIAMYVGQEYMPSNRPKQIFEKDVFSVMTFAYNKNAQGGKCQLIIGDSDIFTRIETSPGVFSPWYGLSKDAITINHSPINSADRFVYPYNDLNTFPVNKIALYVGQTYVPANAPAALANADFISVMAFNWSDVYTGGTVQLAFTNGSAYARFKTADNAFGAWYELGSSDLRNNSIVFYNTPIQNAQTFVAPWNNMNTFPIGRVALYVGANYIPSNAPANIKDVFTAISFNYTKNSIGGSVQICVDAENAFIRFAPTESSFSDWYCITAQNIPYEIMSGFAMFKDICVLGDSWSTGVLNVNENYTQNYNISWVSQMARKYGYTSHNLAIQGSSAQTWHTSEYGKARYLNGNTAWDLYVIMYGINDVAFPDREALGTSADIGTDADTFYGNYSRMVNVVKQNSPNKKILLLTIPPFTAGANIGPYNQAIRQIGVALSVPVADITKYPLFRSSFYTSHLFNNHPTASLYNAIGETIGKALSESLTKDTYWNNYGVTTT